MGDLGNFDVRFDTSLERLERALDRLDERIDRIRERHHHHR
jgi:hypothetical protein